MKLVTVGLSLFIEYRLVNRNPWDNRDQWLETLSGILRDTYSSSIELFFQIPVFLHKYSFIPSSGTTFWILSTDHYHYCFDHFDYIAIWLLNFISSSRCGYQPGVMHRICDRLYMVVMNNWLYYFQIHRFTYLLNGFVYWNFITITIQE